MTDYINFFWITHVPSLFKPTPILALYTFTHLHTGRHIIAGNIVVTYRAFAPILNLSGSRCGIRHYAATRRILVIKLDQKMVD